MTKDEAWELLAGFGSFDKVEHWLSDQPRQAAPDGWTMARNLSGWHFWLRSVPSGLRVTASAPGGGARALWIFIGANDDG